MPDSNLQALGHKCGKQRGPEGSVALKALFASTSVVLQNFMCLCRQVDNHLLLHPPHGEWHASCADAARTYVPNRAPASRVCFLLSAAATIWMESKLANEQAIPQMLACTMEPKYADLQQQVLAECGLKGCAMLSMQRQKS